MNSLETKKQKISSNKQKLKKKKPNGNYGTEKYNN